MMSELTIIDHVTIRKSVKETKIEISNEDWRGDTFATIPADRVIDLISALLRSERLPPDLHYKVLAALHERVA